MFRDGLGATRDYQQSENWYNKAAEQGNADAQYNLGLMYYSGQGVTQDYKQAANWFIKAAGQGYADAQYNLGLMYYSGHGVIQDDKTAYTWLSVAAINGTPEAIKIRDFISPALTPKLVEEAQAEAAEMQKKIEQQNKADKN